MYNIDTNKIREQLKKALKWKFSGGGGKQVVIFGAGGGALLSESCFEMENINPEYFIDDTPSKHGTFFLGKPVISFAEAHELCKGALILVCCGTSRNQGAILKNLAQNPIDGSAFATVDEFVFCKNAEKVLSVYDALEDDVSKATYANMILVRMGKAEQNQEFTVGGKYFGLPAFACIDRQEVFVDCGAYVGDSVEQFIMSREGQFKKIYVFEPDSINFQAMCFRIERLKREWAINDGQIQPVQAGIAQESSQMQTLMPNDLAASSNSSFSLHFHAQADDEAEMNSLVIYSIDEFFSDEKISFLKADIEGFEWPLLAGAETVIRRDKPKLALCIYHNASDMYRIACKIKELRPDYRFSVRQHYCDILETVLYAY